MPFTHLTLTQSPTPRGETPEDQRWHRARAVPATAIPDERERKRSGAIISFLAHLLILLFLIADPPLHTDPNLKELKLGAGGPGPAGGGGGGTSGTGGVRYVQVAPPPKPAAPPVAAPIPVEPPKLPDPVIPELEMPKLATESKVEVKVQSPVVGIGGGTGRDGTAGNGPGSGGGVGSGRGTGRGSGEGPGTGGGDQNVYPPKPRELPIVPLPAPSSVRCFHMVARFDIDEHGNRLAMNFTPTKDGGYNKRLEAMLNSVKWTPGTTLEGTPIRALGQIVYDFGC